MSPQLRLFATHMSEQDKAASLRRIQNIRADLTRIAAIKEAHKPHPKWG